MGLKIKNKINPPIGVLTVLAREIATGKILRRVHVKNIITYEGSQILARSLTGDVDYRITHIYGEHGPPGSYVIGSLNGLVALKSDTINTLRTAPRDTVNAESVLIFSNFTTSEVPYHNNIVTFSASWNSDLLDNQILVGAGLVTEIRGAVLLFAHAYFPAQAKNPGEELICHWSDIFV